MFLLALDTSTAAVTVALHDGERILAESTSLDARRHTELVAPAVVDVLATAGVDRRRLTEIAVGVGPGPFTGLRVGLAAAAVLGAALEVPVRGVCSLDILAYRVVCDAQPSAPFLVAGDARRREVYWAAYAPDGRRTSGPHVGAADAIMVGAGPGDVSVEGASVSGTELDAAGAGPRIYPAAFRSALEPEVPTAADLAAALVAGAVEVLAPEPLYLRRPDATPPSARKSVLT